MEIKEATSYREKIVTLLAAEKLPVADLPATLDEFFVALQDGQLIGVAGLELYNEYALLRSVAVNTDFRRKAVAGALLARIEEHAQSKGLKEIYLLTETAAEYFSRKDYHRITRHDVPAEIQQSSEFSHVCPQSAIVMKKTIDNKA